jgi:hypothetical protein
MFSFLWTAMSRFLTEAERKVLHPDDAPVVRLPQLLLASSPSLFLSLSLFYCASISLFLSISLSVFSSTLFISLSISPPFYLSSPMDHNPFVETCINM